MGINIFFIIMILLLSFYLFYTIMKSLRFEINQNEVKKNDKNIFGRLFAILENYLMYFIPVFSVVFLSINSLLEVNQFQIDSDIVILLSLSSILSIIVRVKATEADKVKIIKYESVIESLKHMEDIVISKTNKGEDLNVLIFAGSGEDTVKRINHLMGKVSNEKKAKITVRVLIMDPNKNKEKEYTDLLEKAEKSIISYEKRGFGTLIRCQKIFS